MRRNDISCLTCVVAGACPQHIHTHLAGVVVAVVVAVVVVKHKILCVLAAPHTTAVICA